MFNDFLWPLPPSTPNPSDVLGLGSSSLQPQLAAGLSTLQGAGRRLDTALCPPAALLLHKISSRKRRGSACHLISKAGASSCLFKPPSKRKAASLGIRLAGKSTSPTKIHGQDVITIYCSPTPPRCCSIILPSTHTPFPRNR